MRRRREPSFREDLMLTYLRIFLLKEKKTFQSIGKDLIVLSTEALMKK